MNDKPKDYEKRQSPTTVVDVAVKKSLNWNLIAQSLIITSIVSVGGMGVAFGKSFLDNQMMAINELKVINRNVAKLSIGVSINSTAIIGVKEHLNHVELRVNQHSIDIKTLYSRTK